MQSHAHWLWFVTKCSKLTERFNTLQLRFRHLPVAAIEMGAQPARLPNPAARRILVLLKFPPEKSDERGFRRAAENDGRAAPRSQTRIRPPPQKSKPSRKTGAKSAQVRAEALPKRKAACAPYRTLELPGANPLKDAHAALDTAVLNAYGFSAKKDLLAQLLSLNQQVATNIENGSPVTAPGIPKNYPDAEKLVTEDCIRPLRM